MTQRLLLGLSMGTSKMAAMESTCIESEKEAQVLGCGWRIVTPVSSAATPSATSQRQRSFDEETSLQGSDLCEPASAQETSRAAPGGVEPGTTMAEAKQAA
jgi:hypothetical protein